MVGRIEEIITTTSGDDSSMGKMVDKRRHISSAAHSDHQLGDGTHINFHYTKYRVERTRLLGADPWEALHRPKRGSGAL